MKVFQPDFAIRLGGPPGRQKTWYSEDKSNFVSKQERMRDDRNGDKHVRKLMDFFEDDREQDG